MSRNVLFALFSLLILLGGLVRVAHVVAHNPVDDIRSDPKRHWEQGIDALRADPMSLIDPVGYQLWVGVLGKLTLKDRHLVAFYTALLSLVTPWIWYRAFREIQPDKLAALGGWAALSILPSWITIYGFFMQETLLLPLLGAALWATWRARRKRDVASFVVLTLAWTLAGLTRGVVIPMAALAAVTVVCLQREPWKAGAVATLVLALVLGPLTYRGYVGLGTFAPSGSGRLAALYARSGKEALRISYERRGETWAYWFRSPATGDAPFAPFSAWKTNRTGVAEVHVDLDAGERDWRRAAAAYPLSVGRYLSLTGENAAHLFFGTSWPDRVRGRTLHDLGRHLRWLWAPLALVVAVWTVASWRRLRGERLLPMLLATWVVVQTLVPISVNEGRYRKPGEGLLIAQVVLLVGSPIARRASPRRRDAGR